MPENDPVMQQRLAALRRAATLMADTLKDELEQAHRVAPRRQSKTILRLWFCALDTNPVLRKFRGWSGIRCMVALRWSAGWLRAKTRILRMFTWRC